MASSATATISVLMVSATTSATIASATTSSGRSRQSRDFLGRRFMYIDDFTRKV